MLRIYELDKMTEEEKERILRRAEVDIEAAVERVRPVVEDVRRRGDQALIEYTKKFDGVDLTPEQLEVSKEDIEKAYSLVEERVVEAIRVAVRNVTKFHKAQMPKERWFIQVDRGIMAGQFISPLRRVGIYVPGSVKGVLPSVVVMLGVPAKVAGVDEVVMCTPPIRGFGDPATLVAADMVGIDRIFRVGGAQAIAAMAYGTQTVPKVDKIVGPGGIYVSAAKRVVSNVVALGTPAGPSEILVLADESAPPELVAADALSEAEHGADSSSVIVTTSMSHAEKILESLKKLMNMLPDRRREFAESAIGNYGGIIVAKNMDEAIEFANEYAAEHLVIMTENPFETVQKIRNAGAVFLGKYSACAAGCYLTGPNSILPTGGYAKSYSATSVYDFIKFFSVEFLTREGLESVADAVIAYTDYERYPGHQLAVKLRFPEKYGIKI